MQAADVRTSRYARLLPLSTRRRKLAPVNTQQLAHQLEAAAHHSVYKLYAVIYHSQELTQFTASKTHPTESLRNHLIGVANWVLFLVRTRASTPLPASAALVGQPGGTPGPVAGEDPRVADEPSLRGETRARGPTLGGVATTSSLRGFRATRSEKNEDRRGIYQSRQIPNRGECICLIFFSN
ncbi:MAG: hypothetical protein ACE5I5_10410 [Candidatus Heimdallarchaeota archaeon]